MTSVMSKPIYEVVAGRLIMRVVVPRDELGGAHEKYIMGDGPHRPTYPGRPWMETDRIADVRGIGPCFGGHWPEYELTIHFRLRNKYH